MYPEHIKAMYNTLRNQGYQTNIKVTNPERGDFRGQNFEFIDQKGNTLVYLNNNGTGSYQANNSRVEAAVNNNLAPNLDLHPTNFKKTILQKLADIILK
tara:strand:- start:185 stop:481 length:297 start_codon:yes stop_codon:yes gene_type:complete